MLRAAAQDATRACGNFKTDPKLNGDCRFQIVVYFWGLALAVCMASMCSSRELPLSKNRIHKQRMSSDESDHSAKGLRMQAELLADKTGLTYGLQCSCSKKI